MKKRTFSLTLKAFLLGMVCLFILNISAWTQDQSLAPGINDRFKQQPSTLYRKMKALDINAGDENG